MDLKLSVVLMPMPVPINGSTDGEPIEPVDHAAAHCSRTAHGRMLDVTA